MKRDTTTAMYDLIDQVRQTLPFDLPEAQMCQGPCNGCSMKLLGFLETELEDWEQRLAEGEKPGLKDLSKLAKTSKKIYQVLDKNGLLQDRE